MSATGASMDELIMCLVGMGFDLEDCEAAVKHGKLSVESAIEWILAGKPGMNAASTLRLSQPSGNVIGSNPFSNPQPLNQPAHPDASSSSNEGEVKVVSRSHLSDEQRRIKERFEEKQREEARRSAQQERLAQKKAREAALQRIKDDREKIRSKKAHEAVVKSSDVNQASSSNQTTTPPKAKNAVLQIRLPDGRALKQSFEPEACLRDVWEFVSKRCPVDGMTFMQPFPRQEFSTEHMEKSLQELALFPTGSLVLKKCENKPAAMDVDSQDTGETSSSPVTPPGQAPADDTGLPSPPRHQWGSGNKLEASGDVSAGHDDQPPGMEVEDDNSDVNDDDEMIVQPPQAVHLPAQPPMGGWHPMDQDHMWGGGQSLMGPVLAPESFPHHRKDPKQLAAEAASIRVAQQPAESSLEGEATCVLLQEVPSLTQTIIEHISGRICDSRHPISSLQGMPAEIAMKVLNHLIQSRLLKPKTLHPFISCHLVKLVLDCYPYTTNELLSAIRLHTYLLHLSLASCPLITDKGLLALNSLKRLKTLNLASCKQLTNNCMALMKELESLVTLSVEDTGVTDEGVIHYAENCPGHLQNLNLSHTQVTHAIMKPLKLVRGLKSLNIEDTQVSSLSGVQELLSLEMLNVCNTPLVTDSLLCLSGHPSLTALNISNTPNINGDLALEYIQNLKLNHLRLPSRLSTTDHGMTFLAGMPLMTLDLTNYINVGDSSMVHIGQIHSLKKLRLSNTKISDTGLSNLHGLTNLQELFLDRTSVGNEGCQILRGLRYLNLPNLSLLNLDGTMVTTDAAWSVRENCPALQNISLKNLLPPHASSDEEEV